MIKNHHLAKHMLDSGWAIFKQMLQDKGKLVFEVDPHYTSVVFCSNCGHKVPKTLAVRIHRCDRCGVVLDRDYNAALNILQRGFQMLAMMKLATTTTDGTSGSYTPVEILAMESRKQEQAYDELIRR